MTNNTDTLFILYGSRTGNAKSVAQLAYEYAQHLGYEAVLEDMQEFDFSKLEQIKNLLVTVSTHGEGEPPVQAEGFYEFIHGPDAPASLDFRYAVAGLGDSSYRYYCQTGKDLDKRFEALGAQRVLEVESCDIDFEEAAKNWVVKAMEAFKPHLSVTHAPGKDGFVFELRLQDSDSHYKAELLDKRLLTGPGSTKKVLHVSLSLRNSGIEYLPGDAIGVHGANSRLFVDELLKTLGYDKAYPVKTKDRVRLLKEVLINDYELTMITPLVMKKYAELAQNEALDRLLQDTEKTKAYADRHDILDLVTTFPAKLTVEQFLTVLRKLSPRLYTVASSLQHQPDTVDITVKVIENEDKKRTRHGVVSSFLWHRLDIGDKVPLSLEKIEKFKLPENDDTPVIMIAAGTGIAPYRGFLQDRKNRQAKGQNWLIFGERNRRSDFLYEDEFNDYLNEGFLDRVDTAFSRDQEQKVYVGHLIEDFADEIAGWMNSGAILYVCGSKNRMAKDVRKALENVFRKKLQLNATAARRHLDTLKSQKRYQEEVY